MRCVYAVRIYPGEGGDRVYSETARKASPVICRYGVNTTVTVVLVEPPSYGMSAPPSIAHQNEIARARTRSAHVPLTPTIEIRVHPPRSEAVLSAYLGVNWTLRVSHDVLLSIGTL